MTDLDALKAELITLRSLDPHAALTRTTAELYLLIEEVERLRGERAAVVAWLRDCETHCREHDGRENAVSATYAHAADAIERGEHRKVTP